MVNTKDFPEEKVKNAYRKDKLPETDEVESERNAAEDSVLLYGTDGKEVIVYYKGQRGEGVYPVTFEGLIKSTERRYRAAPAG